MNVRKKDGAFEPFNLFKMIVTIQKAVDEYKELYPDGEAYPDREYITIIAKRVEDVLLRHKSTITTDLIARLVNDELQRDGYYGISKLYTSFNVRAQEDSDYSRFMYGVQKHLKARGADNQNANLDSKSFGGRIGEATSYVLKDYTLNHLLSPTSRDNHINNRVYIHDLDHYPVGDHNCLMMPIDKLLANGFKLRSTDIRGAKSIGSAFQLLAVLFQVQSLNMFGGVACSHLDWSMVPFVRHTFRKHYITSLKYYGNLTPAVRKRITKLCKDYPAFDESILNREFYQNNASYSYAMEQTEADIKQAVEGFFHNLNALESRAGNQLPFSSINFGTCTLQEGRLVTEAILKQIIEGLGQRGRTSIFPCAIFQCAKGINRKPEDPNYDLFRLALEATAKRLYPNYVNFDWSGNIGYDPNDPKTYMATMGCRTANLMDINGFGQLKDGRGNICPVTVILPTIAMEAKKYFDDKNITSIDPRRMPYFFELLEKTIDEAKDTLLDRFNYICSQSPESAKFMYENGTMEGYVPEEGIYSALKHGTLALGLLGMAEALEIMVGCNQTQVKGMHLAKQICELFRNKCKAYKEEYKLNFAVYYTPAEMLCHTALKKFRNKYGVIPNVSDKEFFTNSIHVPVWEKMDAMKKIQIEANLVNYSSAGCITYIELDADAGHNIDALDTIVNFAMDQDIPYFAINVPNDICLNCGYTTASMNRDCPKCGSMKIQRLKRVTGYLTGDYLTAFNRGKQDEVTNRTKHTNSILEKT